MVLIPGLLGINVYVSVNRAEKIQRRLASSSSGGHSQFQSLVIQVSSSTVNEALSSLTDEDDSNLPDGFIRENDLEQVRKEPYPILDSFEWVTMDLNDETQVCSSSNHIEPPQHLFRLYHITNHDGLR